MRALRTIYRLMLRRTAQMEQKGATIDMQMPIDKSAWLQNGGAHGWATPAPQYMKETLHDLLPWLSTTPYSGTFSAQDLRECLRSEFRHPTLPIEDEPERLNRAFTSLQVIEEQLHMVACSSSAVTNSVRVDVCSAFVGLQSDFDPTFDADNDEAPPKLYFTYRVRVSNIGPGTVQLLGRHWVISDDAGQVVAEVARGARGVVGCTPILKHGTCFQYCSGTDVERPGGKMEGSFQMAVLNAKGLPESTFDAKIAPFTFIKPGME